MGGGGAHRHHRLDVRIGVLFWGCMPATNITNRINKTHNQKTNKNANTTPIAFDTHTHTQTGRPGAKGSLIPFTRGRKIKTEREKEREKDGTNARQS